MGKASLTTGEHTGTTFGFDLCEQPGGSLRDELGVGPVGHSEIVLRIHDTIRVRTFSV